MPGIDSSARVPWLQGGAFGRGRARRYGRPSRRGVWHERAIGSRFHGV